MKILIIEDEAYAVKRLKNLIFSLEPTWELVQVCDEIESSIKWLNSNQQPDLIFMDIQLADGFSFEIFKQVKIISKVIFTTAFDNYAIEAFRHNGLDYLLKPIEKELLQESITRFKKTQNQNTLNPKNTDPISIQFETLSKLITPKQSDYKKRFLTKSGDSLNFIDIENIAYFLSESSYSFVVSKNGNQYILDDTLDTIEKQLNPEIFFRVNRKQIITTNSINSIKSYFNNRLILTLTPKIKDDTIVSRTKVKEFKMWLDQ